MNLEKVLQIGVVVHNLDAAIEEYEKFGIGPWRKMNFDPSEMAGFTVNDKPGDLEFLGAMCHHNGLEFELIQPVSESIFATWLREHGPGVHHIAFVPKEGYDGFTGEFLKNNKFILKGMNADATRGFAYLDTYQQLGFYAEIHKGQPG